MKRVFTVAQVSDIVGAKPETVRRWIRQGKLEATQTSRKAGNVISEEALQVFQENMNNKGRQKDEKPAAISRASSGIITAGVVGTALAGAGMLFPIATTVVASVAAFISGALALSRKQTNDSNVSAKEVSTVIQHRIEELDQEKERLEQDVDAYEQEIVEYKSKIEERKKLIRQLKANIEDTESMRREFQTYLDDSSKFDTVSQKVYFSEPNRNENEGEGDCAGDTGSSS